MNFDSCPHIHTEKVRSSDGSKVYGRRCCACGGVIGKGKCAGCQRDGMVVIVSPKGDLFCSEKCLRDRLTAERKAATAYRRQIACKHQHTEDVLGMGGDVVAARCLDCHKPLRPGIRRGGQIT